MQNMLLAPSGVGLTLCLFESAAPTLKPALRALPLCFPIVLRDNFRDFLDQYPGPCKQVIKPSHNTEAYYYDY